MATVSPVQRVVIFASVLGTAVSLNRGVLEETPQDAESDVFGSLVGSGGKEAMSYVCADYCPLAPGEKNIAEFRCSDGRCIKIDHYCDGTPTCADQSDEKDCPSLSKPKYECEVGYSHWQRAWSLDKKEWCCQNEGRGCVETGGDKYDCLKQVEHAEKWSAGKKAFCCDAEGIGCEDDLKASLEKEHQEALTEERLPFNCNNPNTKENPWHFGKQVFCCEQEKIGCDALGSAQANKGAKPTTTTVPTTTEATTTTTTPPPTTTFTTTLVPTTTIPATTTTEITTTVNPIALTMSCSEQDTAREPLDMPGTMMSKEVDVADCQRRCFEEEGCVYYSYWEPAGDCHLADAASFKTSVVSFLSGPPTCVHLERKYSAFRAFQSISGGSVSLPIMAAAVFLALGSVSVAIVGLRHHYSQRVAERAVAVAFADVDGAE
mmetsp:Transcript_89701/g.187352  ORF Transcript_89701/g.187352 Transcript_89701/m.187352 type:complete len:433 (-) Transcript_89701:361-1659(-)|eukprot:CAMPEP_0206443656 /NCGR_PEP_ID=MMETSP0324_2-20121206/14486_1 /ASSEMBLY_ACC=CAM_ASM_000836 /TAXON_ID=2866 /ORGANISM="Crypthecodinium cohnii, Strain Seligo" /LENGTH=432 /DNA_ID=CAMNT_0053911609 /DNA_START=37 /DNA_END=1335 /DNA_ORIENTATION=+